MASKEIVPTDLGDEDMDADQELEAGQEEEPAQERAGWEGSDVTQSDIAWLRRTRRIPDGVDVRLPTEEIIPDCRDGEYVVFLAHFERGFSLPLSDFSKKFLEIFKLQPHHLPANAITSISAYISFCEAYLGVQPTIKLWAKYFKFRRQVLPDPENPDPKAPKQMVQCGAATIVPRRGSIFPRIKGLDSCKKWLKSFFYVKNSKADTDLIRLPKYKFGPPIEEHNWGYEPKDVAEVDQIHLIIIQLKKEGMTSDDLLRTFISRRISPLQLRTHKMCHMSGRYDPNRTTTVELTKAEIRRRVRAIAKTAMVEEWEWGKAPYDRNNPAPSRGLAQWANEDTANPPSSWGKDRTESDAEDLDTEDHMPLPMAIPGSVPADSDAQVITAPLLAVGGRGKRGAGGSKKKPAPKKRRTGPLLRPTAAGDVLNAEQGASSTSPLSRPSSPPWIETRIPSPARPSTSPANQGTTSDAEIGLPGGQAETEEEHRAPEHETMYDAGADTSALERDDDPGAINKGAGSESLKTPEDPAKHQQQQNQQDQQLQQKQQPPLQPPPQLTPQPTPIPQQQKKTPLRAQPQQKLPKAAAATSSKGVELKKGSTLATASPNFAAPAQNPDRQITAYEGRGTEVASTHMTGLRQAMATAGTKAGFVTTRTLSGNSLGSLGHYSMDWNLADVSEVSSNPSLPAPGPRLHPAAPGVLAHKLSMAKKALDEADKAAELCTNTRTKLYQKLLLEHRELSTKHSALQLELRDKARTKEQMDELLKRIDDLQAEKKALEDRHQDCMSMSDLASQLKERDEKHHAELKKEQEEVSRLKLQVGEMKKNHATEIQRVVAEEKERHGIELQKYKDLLTAAEEDVTSSHEELDGLKAKAKIWKDTLTKINSEMTM